MLGEQCQGCRGLMLWLRQHNDTDANGVGAVAGGNAQPRDDRDHLFVPRSLSSAKRGFVDAALRDAFPFLAILQARPPALPPR